MYQDPLERLRHALVGLALALVLAILIAAVLARLLGDRIADDYGLRVGIYLGLMIYLIAGAVVLFVKVARHETRPVSLARVARWTASLWLWPLLWLAARASATPDRPGDGPSGGPGTGS